MGKGGSFLGVISKRVLFGGIISFLLITKGGLWVYWVTMIVSQLYFGLFLG